MPFKTKYSPVERIKGFLLPLSGGARIGAFGRSQPIGFPEAFALLILFHSQVVLLAFLPLTSAAYNLLFEHRNARVRVLIIASLGLYGYWDLRFLPLLFSFSLPVSFNASYVATSICEFLLAELAHDAVPFLAGLPLYSRGRQQVRPGPPSFCAQRNHVAGWALAIATGLRPHFCHRDGYNAFLPPPEHYDLARVRHKILWRGRAAGAGAKGPGSG